MKHFYALILLSLAAYGQAANPTLTPAQIQAAIEKGREYKSGYDYFKKRLKGKKVAVAAYEDVTFFNDWQNIALQSADATFQMRELKPEDVRADGLLHAYVDLRLTVPFLGVNWNDVAAADSLMRGSNLILVIDGRTVQPVRRRVIGNHGATVFLAFDFDLSPADLSTPLTIVSIDGDDGRKHRKTNVNLSGVIETPAN